MVQGQQRACMPVYIGKSGDLVGCYRCLTHSLTHRQQNIELLSLYKVKSLSWVTQFAMLLSNVLVRSAVLINIQYIQYNQYKQRTFLILNCLLKSVKYIVHISWTFYHNKSFAKCRLLRINHFKNTKRGVNCSAFHLGRRSTTVWRIFFCKGRGKVPPKTRQKFSGKGGEGALRPPIPPKTQYFLPKKLLIYFKPYLVHF